MWCSAVASKDTETNVWGQKYWIRAKYFFAGFAFITCLINNNLLKICFLKHLYPDLFFDLNEILQGSCKIGIRSSLGSALIVTLIFLFLKATVACSLYVDGLEEFFVDSNMGIEVIFSQSQVVERDCAVVVCHSRLRTFCKVVPLTLGHCCSRCVLKKAS